MENNNQNNVFSDENNHLNLPQKAEEAFSRGYDNGLKGINKQHYEGYISEKYLQTALQEAININVKLLDNITEKLDINTTQLSTLQLESTQLNEQINHKKSLLVRRLEDFLHYKNQKNNYLQEKENLRNKYSFLAGVLFLVAGFIFIVGDLVISHEIVAYALNIKNNVEAWTFAVGLAMVSVLLKPAYDRLIEQPYLYKKTFTTEVIYLIFKVLLVFFTFVTLFTLGLFRYEAYKTDRLKESINKNILQLQADDISEQNERLILLKSKESENLSLKLVEHPAGLYSFVFSGIMFAVAGAICLGLSFPILGGYTRIWLQIPMRLRRILPLEKNALLQVEILENELHEKQSDFAVRQEEILLIGDLDVQKQEKTKLTKQLLDNKDLLRKSLIDSDIYLYEEGYERGILTTKIALETEQKAIKAKQEEMLEALKNEAKLKQIIIPEAVFENAKNGNGNITKNGVINGTTNGSVNGKAKDLKDISKDLRNISKNNIKKNKPQNTETTILDSVLEEKLDKNQNDNEDFEKIFDENESLQSFMEKYDNDEDLDINGNIIEDLKEDFDENIDENSTENIVENIVVETPKNSITSSVKDKMNKLRKR